MNRSIWKFLTSLRLTIVLLALAIILVFVGTVAQADEGLYQVQNRYFRHWIVLGTTLFGHKLPWLIWPGGYTIGISLLVNLVAAHIKRFHWRMSKVGIHLTHLGIIVLLVGQLATDMLQVESRMTFLEGQSDQFHRAPQQPRTGLHDRCRRQAGEDRLDSRGAGRQRRGHHQPEAAIHRAREGTTRPTATWSSHSEVTEAANQAHHRARHRRGRILHPRRPRPASRTRRAERRPRPGLARRAQGRRRTRHRRHRRRREESRRAARQGEQAAHGVEDPLPQRDAPALYHAGRRR